MKIWQTLMGMKGESKMVVDAMYEVIMKGWNPSASVRPLNAATFLVRILSSALCRVFFFFFYFLPKMG